MKYTSESIKLQNFIDKRIDVDTEPLTMEAKRALVPIFQQMDAANEAYKAATFSRVSRPVFEPEHVPHEIKKLLSSCSRNYVAQFRIHHRTITVSINAPSLSASFVKQCVHRIFVWLHVASAYAHRGCSNNLNIHLYLTEHTKQLCETDVLGEVNVNTAYTFACRLQSAAPANICIFRMEEWFKVFIHETFHSLGLDFSSMTGSKADAKIRELFSIRTDIRTYEAYAETWAEILHSMFVSFHSTQSKTNYELMFRKLNHLLDVETRFSLFQCAKVLRYNNVTYQQLRKPNVYQEDSNIFAYYVLKTILMYNKNKFIEWCSANNTVLLDFNKTTEGVASFCGLFRSLYLERHFIDALADMELVRTTSGFQKSTLRMTAIELA